jgi:hypothetical protein
VTKTGHDPARARKRDWRRVHHSPWFWVGVAMFMAAILTYVFSEDLSLRPRRHVGLETGPDRILLTGRGESASLRRRGHSGRALTDHA